MAGENKGTNGSGPFRQRKQKQEMLREDLCLAGLSFIKSSGFLCRRVSAEAGYTNDYRLGV
jgi:hypothetical protein